MTLEKQVADKKVRYILNTYLDLIRREFAPAQVWLWGSRIYGQPDEFSDVDIIVVSDRFEGMPFHERRRLFRNVTGVDKDPNAEVIDVLCYTPSEFAEKANSPTIIREAVEKGLRAA